MYEPGWFATLLDREDKKGLLSVKEYEFGNMIVFRDDRRSFRMFDDYLEFGRYLYEVPMEQRSFFEVILGNTPQKFYLDIDTTTQDISLEDSITFIDYLLDTLDTLLKELTGRSFPLLVFSSHGGEKISYHVIVDQLFVQNNVQGKILYSKLFERLDERKRFLDGSLFKSTQQMRIWSCTKHGKNRQKKFSGLSRNEFGEEWQFTEGEETDKEKFFTILGASLITNVNVCQLLPPFDVPVKKREFSTSSDAVVVMDEDVVDEVLELYCMVHELDTCPFEYLDTVQDEDARAMILCKRVSPSYCQECERIHEHENVYFLVWEKEYHVSFSCRRNEKNQYLGALRKAAPAPVREEVELKPRDVITELDNFTEVFDPPSPEKRISRDIFKEKKAPLLGPRRINRSILSLL